MGVARGNCPVIAIRANPYQSVYLIIIYLWTKIRKSGEMSKFPCAFVHLPARFPCDGKRERCMNMQHKVRTASGDVREHTGAVFRHVEAPPYRILSTLKKDGFSLPPATDERGGGYVSDGAACREARQETQRKQSRSQSEAQHCVSTP